MDNLISFLRMFLSYLLVVGVCALIIAAAIFIGIKLRKSKNLKDDALNAEGSEAEN
ncbi:MAG: hypothetical protein K6A38_03350 [Lachnospiraceae bacterium]|nr:hypothetical protein [Lachnospiraceae bacterium]